MASFAVVDSTGNATIVSSSEHGAKVYATRNGYRIICEVSPYSMSCYDLKEKKGKKWVQSEE
jgi:hypothetical protein